MKTRNTILTVALLLFTAFSIFAQQADPESDFAVELIDNGRAVRITGYNGNRTAVNIPPRIRNLPVTEIGERAFVGNSLTSVTIPNSVTSIGNHAFATNRLTSVTIGNGVRTIGNNAFWRNQLTSVTIPNNATSIGVAAFASNRLTSVVLPNSVTYLAGFSNNQIANITIPNSVTTIGHAAFAANQLTNVTIPNNVTTIEDFAFKENLLTSVTIGNRVTSIGQGTFHKNRLTSVNIPSSVTNIGIGAFAENNLTSLTIPNSVTTIRNYAFAENRLTSVSIPNRAAQIAGDAFWGNNIISITVGGSARSLNPWPNLSRYADIIFGELQNNGPQWRTRGINYAESNQLGRQIAALEGHNSINTDLKAALGGYYIGWNMNEETESILPRSLPRQVDMQLGFRVYMNMITHRFFGDTAAVSRHEAMLQFITSRGNATSAEIETFYRNNNVRELVNTLVDKEFGGVNVPSETVTYIKQSLANFLTTPNQTNFNTLKSIYDSTIYVVLDSYTRNAYQAAIANALVFEDMGMTGAAEAARNTIRTVENNSLNPRRRTINAPNNAPIDWVGFSDKYIFILNHFSTELIRRMR
ncbi:MAG: leucine-rich repeat domain-containing protein [Treponema sp.]|nr:leucine-rich repeat domain-containing protein [Treponema sp.]